VIQALSFVPLIVASLTGKFAASDVFVVIAVYWAMGQSGGSAWNAWVEDLVPERVRASFFARRTRFVQAGIIAGFLVGGFALQFGHRAGYGLAPFALLFGVAALSRIVSANYLDSQSDVRLPARRSTPRPWRDFFAITTQGGNSRILLYILAAQLGCQISGPYFTPYMLGHLKLSYLGYVTLICIAYLARVAVAPVLARIIEKIGVRRMLWISGLGIVPLPALWDVSDSFTYLSILQVYSGAVWAAYELANLLLIIESIPAAKKINILTVYNFVNAMAIVGGSFIGGFLLTAFGGGRHAYLMLFLISTLARAAALLMLVKLPIRLPGVGRSPAAASVRTVVSTPPVAARPVLKPASVASRTHGTHAAVPKPAFLRFSTSAVGELNSEWAESSVAPAVKQI
jgi:MFS family permease